jgi:sugar/nucleoside kinase (ribokinase family)
MLNLVAPEPVDYLVIGHLTCDVTPNGLRLGGSAAFSALTAKATGLRVGVVTAWGNEIPLTALDGIQVVAISAEHSTTFENVQTSAGRVQYLHHQAPRLDFANVPEMWRRTPIIHIAPVAQEVGAVLPEGFRPALLGLTPQGWLRRWTEDRRVHACAWPGAEEALNRAGAAILSVEDVGGSEEEIERFMLASRLLVITENSSGARLYWNHDLRRFPAPRVHEIDPTGAGDIFAAAFFARLYLTRDPWEAARFAVQMSAISVTRPGLEGVPTHAEYQSCLMEVLH